MCGIYGVVRSAKLSRAKSKPLCDYIKDAAFVGTVRGDDSSGMFQLRENGFWMRHKSVFPGPVFLSEERTQALIRMVDDSTITIGHHRAATNTIIAIDTAHPFEHVEGNRKVIGVHNGFISNHKYTDDGKTFRVDSDWMFYDIFKRGLQAVADLEGAATLVWMEEDGKLRIYSNGKRPIFWNYLKDEEAMLIASEWEMMYWLSSRHQMDLEKTMFTCHEDRVYIFDPKEPLRKFVTDKLPKKTPKPVYHYTPSPAPTPTPSPSPSERDAWAAARQAARDKHTLNTRNTFQGKEIDYTPTSVACMGSNIGDDIDFFLSRKMQAGISYNIVGEVFVDNYEGGTDCVPAIMINTTADILDNLKRIDEEGGQCTCRVIGCSMLMIGGKEEPCIIVNRPANLVIGDPSAFIPTDIPVYSGTKVSVGKFLDLTKDGCDNCGEKIDVADARAGKLVWTLSDHKPICPKCAFALSDHLSVQQIIEEQRTGTD